MGIYKKLPVIIDAIQFDAKDNAPLLSFVQQITGELPEKYIAFENGRLYVKTLEGDMRVNGEFYPCKPDIFEKSYESIGA